MFKMILQQSAILAQLILNEKLHKLGILGCVMCIAGSIIIVIHAPQERPISSVQEIWSMATQPGEKILACTVLGGWILSKDWRVPTQLGGLRN